MNVNIITYNIEHKNYIVEIFKSNCPKYFDINDLDDLLDFLDKYADENFKVLIIDNEIIGCGGHYVNENEKIFGIAWVMFKRNSLGLRKFLTVSNIFFEHLMENIRNENKPFDILINTTQLLEKTFNNFGFYTEKIIKNGFGDNLDHYVMRKKIVEN
ncbi:hypothetical protein JCM31826_04330 [Thermaurantimonas aggregans]|uniref:N-acetyltransferase domain-containing protein n=2 Tax=Thermaurantimonas aggregans TaxID=2173829 RepID=A0A401XIY9_9FLAO|nr:N-acetyltransferase [Thermaurantimonas aggregans]GCD76951.1 hypothetical protein JCM31826_04330 [Thermaurantimonas aggregans]